MVHNGATAASNEDAEEGLLFIQEMMELMKTTDGQSHTILEAKRHHLPLTVIPLVIPPLTKLIHLTVGSAQFGKQLHGKSGVS